MLFFLPSFDSSFLSFFPLLIIRSYKCNKQSFLIYTMKII